MIRLIFPHIALFLANTIYAVNFLFAKDVMPDYITPTGFILLRVSAAAIREEHNMEAREDVQRSNQAVANQAGKTGPPDLTPPPVKNPG